MLFDFATANMTHDPCGNLNHSSPYMADRKWTKNLLKISLDKITNVDGYPIYRQRNPDNGRQSFFKNINNIGIDIDNRYVVSYSPLLSKTFNAQIDVEFCSSAKSIKYICKYMWIKAVIWQYSELKILIWMFLRWITMMKQHFTKLADSSNRVPTLIRK